MVLLRTLSFNFVSSTSIFTHNLPPLGKQSTQTKEVYLQLNIAMTFTLKTKDYNTTRIKRADNTLHLFLRVCIRLTRKQLKRFVCMNFVKNVYSVGAYSFDG